MTSLQPRRPYLVYTILGLTFLIALIILISQLDPQARAAREAASWRQAEIDSQLLALDLFVAGAWRLLPLVLVCATASIAAIIVYQHWGAPASISAGYQVRELQAIHQPGQGPQQLTYSPHLVQRPIQTSTPMPITLVTP